MNKIIVSLFAFALIVFAGSLLIGTRDQIVVKGGVNIGNDCTATTSVSSWANVPHMIASSTNGTPDIQTLCSIVIGTTHGSIVEIWNATSSTDVSSTTIAVIAASPAIGSTLTFDAKITRGLMINTATGFTGRYTINYR